MKKYLMAAVALICMTMACVTLTACSSDDKEEFVSYVANPDGSYDFSDLAKILNVTQEMNSNINKAFNGSAYKRNDSKAIQVCDEVAEKYRSLITCKITLSMGVASSNPDATNLVVIKTYSFPY